MHTSQSLPVSHCVTFLGFTCAWFQYLFFQEISNTARFKLKQNSIFTKEEKRSGTVLKYSTLKMTKSTVQAGHLFYICPLLELGKLLESSILMMIVISTLGHKVVL